MTTERTDRTLLDRTMVRGVAWTAAVKWGAQALSWGSMVVLARILGPSDFGLIGMAALYLGLINNLTEGGLGSTILALRNMTAGEIAQFNSVALLLGLAGTAATCLAAFPLGSFFHSAELPGVVFALSVQAFLSSLRLVPTALMQRDLRFRALALVEGIQGIVQTVATLGFALAGFQYWSLAIGTALGTAAASIASIALSPHSFAWPRRGTLGRYFHFTRDVLVGRVAWYVYTNADFTIGGRMLGAAALGAYSFAWSIASVPVEKITALVTRVTPGIISRLQDDRAETVRMVLNVSQGLGFLTLPASIAMAAVAPDFVRVYLGAQWLGAIVPLQILSLYAMLRSLVTLMHQLLTLRKDTRYVMLNGILTAIVLPVAFVIGSRWGAPGIAMMWVVVYPIFAVPLFVRAFRMIGLPATTYIAALWPPLRAGLIMGASMVLAGRLAPPAWSPGARLILMLAVGALVFTAAGIAPERDRLRRLIGMLRGGQRVDVTGEPAAAA